MKKVFPLVGAGFVGGLLVLIVNWFIMPVESYNSLSQRSFSQSVKNVNVAPYLDAPFDFVEAAAIATPAVVHIEANGKVKQQQIKGGDQYSPFDFFFDDFLDDKMMKGSGSGVIYTRDGYIITNYHVIKFAETIEVTLNNNDRYSAKVVGSDPTSDLAVLKIDAQNLPILKVGNSDAAKVGEWVVAVGNPFNLNSTVTAGIISAKGRSFALTENMEAIEAFIQTDAAVNPGNSGGALVDAKGHLLGINTAIATRTGRFQGYSFAIPSSLVTRIADDIIRYGEYQRPYLGVQVYDLDAEIAEELGVPINQGVVIDEVENGGPAMYAGVNPKDVIIKIDNKQVRNVADLQEIISRSRVGDVLNIAIQRKNKIIDVSVKLNSK